MEFFFVLGLLGVVAVAAWVIPRPEPRNRRDDGSTILNGDTTSAGHVHSDHCGHGHDGGGDCGGDGGGGDGGGGGD